MRPVCAVDIECFSNWYLVGITCKDTRARWDYHLTPGGTLDTASITALLKHFQMITFNGGHYDEMMLVAGLQGYNNEQLKQLNDFIITSGKPDWMIRKDFRLWAPDWLDHIDVMSVIPGIPISLKMNAGRLHAPVMQDSPVSFKVPIPVEMIPHETEYCGNDREVTLLLHEELSKDLKLREALSARFGVDVRSKSGAQAAEHCIQAEWVKRVTALPAEQRPPHETDYKGRIRVKKRVIRHGFTFKYDAPDWIHFVTPQMQRIFEDVKQLDFFVSDKEQAVQLGANPDEKIKTGVVMPDYLKKLVINIGKSRYKMGIGGLHSQESCAAHITLPGFFTMRTADVASYYPSLIVNLRMCPDALGPLFHDIYVDFKAERLDAKGRAKQIAKLANLSAEEETLLAELLTTEVGLKLLLNSCFGKLWSKHSIFFAPEQGVRVTMTGQFGLLMLIERLELAGISVVSANTDGVEMKIPFGLEGVCSHIVAWWEKVTGLDMEQEDYEGLYSRDVNNYIRVDKGGKIKRKGTYRASGVLNNKTPKNDICAEAVVQYLKDRTPVADTIRACTDIRMFIEVRKAGEGGCYSTPHNPVVITKLEDGVQVSGGQFLGKAVRWYLGRDARGCYIANQKGDKVAGSDGCVPCMVLPQEFPNDVDIPRYIDIAESMLEEIGFGIPF